MAAPLRTASRVVWAGGPLGRGRPNTGPRCLAGGLPLGALALALAVEPTAPVRGFCEV